MKTLPDPPHCASPPTTRETVEAFVGLSMFTAVCVALSVVCAAILAYTWTEGKLRDLP